MHLTLRENDGVEHINKFSRINRDTNTIDNNIIDINTSFGDYLSNRRISCVSYYYWTFSFKEKVRDKEYITFNGIKNFIPIRWVFQYKLDKWPWLKFSSKYLDDYMNDWKIKLLKWDNYQLYKDINDNYEFNIRELLFNNVWSSKFKCSYMLFWYVEWKLIYISFPIKVYIMLKKDIEECMKYNFSLDISWDILKDSNSININRGKNYIKFWYKNSISNEKIFEYIDRYNKKVDNWEVIYGEDIYWNTIDEKWYIVKSYYDKIREDNIIRKDNTVKEYNTIN